MNSSSHPSATLRLLVLAPNWLGDVVMHTPLLSYLDSARTDILAATGRELSLTLGVRNVWADLFNEDPRVDELLVLDRGGRLAGLGGTFRLASIFKRAKFDAVILCPPSLRTGVAVWLAGIPSRVGYRADGRSVFLTNGLRPSPRGDQHYSREMMALGEAWLSSLGMTPDESEEGVPETSLPGCADIGAASNPQDRPYWVLAPGTTYGEAKSWPLARVGEMASLTRESRGVRLVFLGDEAARGFTSQLRGTVEGSWGEDLGGTADFVDLTGLTNLAEAVSVLKSSSAFVGNDSGLMHLAAALGKPTVGIFGSSNPDWTAPVGPRTRAVTPHGFDCRPCYLKKCNQAQFCLETVEAGTVLSAVEELVDRNGVAEGEK